jgi:hypothetical protein
VSTVARDVGSGQTGGRAGHGGAGSGRQGGKKGMGQKRAGRHHHRSLMACWPEGHSGGGKSATGGGEVRGGAAGGRFRPSSLNTLTPHPRTPLELQLIHNSRPFGDHRSCTDLVDDGHVVVPLWHHANIQDL